MSPPLFVLSNVIVDSIVLADGTELSPKAGGAGLYAAAAAAAWWSPVALLAGVGRDFDSVTGGIAEAYAFAREGLIRKGDHCIQSKLVYRDDGSRTETPAFGMDHFATMQIDCTDIPPTLGKAEGTYIFRDGDPKFWQSVDVERERLGIVVWEIDREIANSKSLRFSDVVSKVDVVSLNVEEAELLFGESPPMGAVSQLHRAGAGTVILRMGARGALVSDGVEAFAVRPPQSPVVDVTGGGNAFTGGFLAGYCGRGGGLERAARSAAAAAAVAIAQAGPPFPASRDVLSALAAGTIVEPITI